MNTHFFNQIPRVFHELQIPVEIAWLEPPSNEPQRPEPGQEFFFFLQGLGLFVVRCDSKNEVHLLLSLVRVRLENQCRVQKLPSDKQKSRYARKIVYSHKASRYLRV